jgi:hypothetical protein
MVSPPIPTSSRGLSVAIDFQCFFIAARIVDPIVQSPAMAAIGPWSYCGFPHLAVPASIT